MIFAREKFADAMAEMLPLLKMHYQEIAWNQERIPLDIDTERYLDLEENGKFALFTGRDGGKLAAYGAFFLSAHPHYKSTMYAANDVLFVHPRFRGVGGKFINYIEEHLKNLGIQCVTYHVKEKFDWGSVLDRRGFERTDHIWQKYIGEG